MALSKEQMLRAYRKMKQIRTFEERIHVENTTGEIPGFTHLYAGEEAMAVGVCENLTERDYIGSTHRGHGHSIAKGCDIEEMMCEIYGKRTGLCGGKGGSMHIADISKGMLGANGIVGAGVPPVAGAALACKLTRNGGVAVAFSGDGASNQGLVFETLNAAVVLQLPCIFMFENNGYGEFTGHDYAVGCRDITSRAAAFGMPAVKVDGTDFFAVYEAAHAAVERARRGEGPSTIEATAMRYFGHFEGDPMIYRAENEVADLRRDKDPLKVFRRNVAGKIDEAELDAIDREVEAQIDKAVQIARAAPQPDPADLLTDVYVSY